MSTATLNPTVDLAQTFARRGANADRVRTPENRDNMGKNLREYELTWAKPGTIRDAYSEDEDNAFQIDVSYDSRAKRYEAVARITTMTARGSRTLIGADYRERNVVIATSLPAGRYSRKALDGFTRTVLADLDTSIDWSSRVGRHAADVLAAVVAGE
jgi:hypothetical protein